VLLDGTQAQTDKVKKYALLLVGVRDYDSGKFRNLKYTENDAEGLAGVRIRGLDQKAHTACCSVGAAWLPECHGA
jgi:hypothetical protein